MQVKGKTTWGIADQIRGQAKNGVLRAKVLGVDAIVNTNTWKATNSFTTTDAEYYLFADDLASQDPAKLGGEDIADANQQSLIENRVTWTKWGDPIIYAG